MSNVWLEAYRNRINYTLRQMEEYHLKGSYGGNLNLKEIIQMLRGACTEIAKLQKEIDEIKNDYEELMNQITKINTGENNDIE